MERFGFEPEPTEPSDGNIFSPEPELNAIDGGWREQRHGVRLTSAAMAAAMALAPVAWWGRRRLRA